MKKDTDQVRPQGEPAAKGFVPRWRLWLFMLVLLVGSAGASFVVFKYIAPSIPRELVGVWQVVDGDLQGATLEFQWYGSAVATIYKQGKKGTINSSVKVDGDKIFLTSKDALSGKEETLIQTILTLTDNELVIRDADKHVYRMVRIR